MPSPRQDLTLGDARRAIAERGFAAPTSPPSGTSPAGRVGIELEWLAVSLDDPTVPASFAATRAALDALGALPGASRVTFEPGGQVELSAPPRELDDACTKLRRDAAVVGDALARAGIGLVALGLEPGVGRTRCVRAPRYDAMEAFFDLDGPEGRRMMRSTAGAQVNLDLGPPDEAAARWQVAHDVGPTLAAAFANSPFGDDGPSGHHSTRLDNWSQIDATRTDPVARSCTEPGAGAWADYALAARVMQVCVDDQRHEPVLTGCSFADWIERPNGHGHPTLADLEYHLTTLFPPVRPRGWLELRMLDALPGPLWPVATAVTTAVVCSPEIRERVVTAARPARELWVAATDGLDHPLVACAAVELFAAAIEVLPDLGADTDLVAAVTDFGLRYVARGRCPADDLLDRYARDGTTVPTPENAPEAAWT